MNLLMSHTLGGDWPPAVRRLVAELCAKCQGCRSARRTRVYFPKGITAEKGSRPKRDHGRKDWASTQVPSQNAAGAEAGRLMS
jgi:hypothetical protein